MFPPADIFDPARTHCPSCNATQHKLSDLCSFCGFNAQICVQRYPFAPPSLERFVDPDRKLTQKDQRILAKSINRLEKRFPQVTVSVAVMNLPKSVDGREFGYWFLNSSPAKDKAAAKRRLHHILVLVDQSSQTVSITVGYGLDSFLHDQVLYASLERTASDFTHRGFVAGIRAWLKHIGNDLLPIQREAAFAAERWSRHHGHESPDPEPVAPVAVSQAYHQVVAPNPLPNRQQPVQAPLQHQSK